METFRLFVLLLLTFFVRHVGSRRESGSRAETDSWVANECAHGVLDFGALLNSSNVRSPPTTHTTTSPPLRGSDVEKNPEGHIVPHLETATCWRTRCSLLFKGSFYPYSQNNLTYAEYWILLQPLQLQCKDYGHIPSDPFIRHAAPLTVINDTSAVITFRRAPGTTHLSGRLRLCGCFHFCSDEQSFQTDLGVLRWDAIDKTHDESTILPPIIAICSLGPFDPCRVYIEQPYVHSKKWSIAVVPLGALCVDFLATSTPYTDGWCVPERELNGRRSGTLTAWICQIRPPTIVGVYDVCLRVRSPRSHAIVKNDDIPCYVGRLVVVPNGSLWSWMYATPTHDSGAMIKPSYKERRLLSRDNAVSELRAPLDRLQKNLTTVSTPPDILPTLFRERANNTSYMTHQKCPTLHQTFVQGKRRALQSLDELLPPLSMDNLRPEGRTQQTGDPLFQYRRFQDSATCQQDTDCLFQFGRCENSKCRGFFPNTDGDNRIRCVSGYICNIRPGSLPGVRVGSDFQVIAVGLQEVCGAADPLKSTESIFGNTNRWQCNSEYFDDCVFTAGVGLRRNASAPMEGVRLCGCPNIDANDNGEYCDNKREFFVPLGTLTLQECMRNAHCADRGLASCDEDHCIRGAAVAATAGLKVLQCLTSRNCGLKDLGSRTVSESMKLLPIASSFSCGAESALDPDAIQDASLPCIIDVNNDGQCEINLGTKMFGTKRLCGCVGDRGGNGRDCDQIEDFTDEMGIVDAGECSSDEDCKERFSICLNRECKIDNLEPSVVGSIPANTSYAVPPVNEITLIWHESIKFTKNARKVVIVSADPDLKHKWEVTVSAPDTYSIAETGYKVDIQGSELRIIPDISMASFPEGSYVVGYEGGIVSDLAGNYNKGAINIMFTVSKNAGCPHLAITGFSAVGNNPNGVYSAMDPINGHAAWTRGGRPGTLHLYWRERDMTQGHPGSWIISSRRDGNAFVAYANLTMMEHLGREGELRPPGHAWKKYEPHHWIEHSDITVTCTDKVDREPPVLIDMSPPNNAMSVKPHNLRVTLRFSEPVTYGHWANFTFVATEGDHVVQLIPDFEAGMRGRHIKSDMKGTIELDLTGFADLLPGTKYNLLADFGFVTDLFYNPWDGEAEQLSLTTFGVSCKPFPDLGDAYQASGNNNYSHGATYSVQCNEGYTAIPVSSVTSPISDSSEESEDDATDNPPDTRSKSSEFSQRVKCSDGQWEPLTFQCKADCPRYQAVSSEYQVVERFNQIESTYPHGTTLPVKCADRAVVIENLGNATLKCNDGHWDVLSLKCRATCGPFPSLGPHFRVSLDDSLDTVVARGTLVGARRIVHCAPPAVATVGTQPEVVVCEEEGWNTIKLECHVGCSKTAAGFDEGYVLDDPNPETILTANDQHNVEAGIVPHGVSRQLTCAPGYQGEIIPSSNRHPRLQQQNLQQQLATNLRCDEGSWVPDDSLKCYKNCGPLELGVGYKVYPLSGKHGSHMSTAKIQCAKLAAGDIPSSSSTSLGFSGRQQLLNGGLESNYGTDMEVLKCVNGAWTAHSLVCYAPCVRPEEALGRKSYIARILNFRNAEQEVVENTNSSSSFSDGLIRHGIAAALYCSPSSEIAAGIPPEVILCHDGYWVSAPENALNSVGGLFKHTAASPQRLMKPKLVCQTRCGPHLKDKLRYIDIGGPGVLEQLARHPVPEGARRQIQCRQGFSPVTPQLQREGTLVCTDGRWVEETPFTCLESCLKPAFSELFQRGYDLVDPRITAVDHSQTVSVTCRRGLTVRLGVTNTVVLARCTNGRFILPMHGCGPPSCSDGIQNGDEKGVDCGGSTCPTRLRECPSCKRVASTNAVLEQQSLDENLCAPSCDDGLRNGDEEGVDCGGKYCPSCRVCTDLPSELQYGMAWSTDRGLTFHNVTVSPMTTQLTHTENLSRQSSFAFAEGTLLDVRCALGFDQISTSPALGFQTFQCSPRSEAEPSGWILGESAYNFVLRCGLPRCDDGIKNGDEWDVDCGGNCLNPCPTCQDGVQNGDEEDVDCGGTRCLPCNACLVTPFKTLMLKNVEVLAFDAHETPVTLSQFWDTRATEHNSRRKILCRQNRQAFVILRCRNGVWRIDSGNNPGNDFNSDSEESESDGFRAIEALPCDAYGSQDDFQFGQTTLPSVFVTQHDLTVPMLPEPRACASVLSYSGTQRQTFASSAQLDSANITSSELSKTCCGMISSFNTIMSSECGALLFGSRNSQISGFCTGLCASRLQKMLQQYKHNQGLGCATFPLLEEMVGLFCSTGQPLGQHTGVGGNAAIASVVTGSGRADTTADADHSFCFATADIALTQIRNIKDLRGPLLDAACLPNSCFRSLFRYFELLSALMPPKKNIRSTEDSLHRNLRETHIWNNDSYSRATTFPSNGHFVGPSLSDLWEEKYNPLLEPDLQKRRVRALGPAMQSPLMGIRHLLLAQRFSGKLLDFLCLKDAKGNSCGPSIDAILSGDNGSPFSSQGAAARLRSSDSCSTNKCLWEVTRYLGQSLYIQGKRSINPYTTILGLLMRTYGRVACQTSLVSKKSCGLVMNFNLTASTTGRGFDVQPLVTPYSTGDVNTASTVLRYPHCKCPIAYVGDGVCDAECFNPACGFDGEDCTLQKMFPYVYQGLNAVLPVTNPCHPFSARFRCFPASVGCHKRITEVLENDGCCAATRWDILREVLNAEVELQALSTAAFLNKTSSGTTNVNRERHPRGSEDISRSSLPAVDMFSGEEAPRRLILDRSTFWIEATCRVSLNRACAGGITRSRLRLRFLLTHLKYDPLFTKPEYRHVASHLISSLREAFSNSLALPLYDVSEIRVWPWDVDVEVVIDPGVLFAEVQKHLEALRDSGELQKSINQAVRETLSTATPAERENILLPPTKQQQISEQESPLQASLARRSLQDMPSDLNNFETLDFVGNLQVDSEILQDAPVSVSQSPRLPQTGTLDMSELSDDLWVPSCSSTPDLSLPQEAREESQPGYPSPYEVDLSGPREGFGQATGGGKTPHGSVRRVRCAEGYETSLSNSGASPQFLVCDRGRWVTVNPGEPKIVCRKPCSPYEEWDFGYDTRALLISAIGGNKDGATRVVQCAARYAPLEGGKSSETLFCRNGVWGRRTLECGRVDELGSAALLNSGTCGNLRLSQVVVPAEVFLVRQVMTVTTVDAQRLRDGPTSSQLFLPVTKSSTKLQLWSVVCTRGYVPSPPDIRPVALLCVNETLLAARDFGTTVGWDTEGSNSAEPGATDTSHSMGSAADGDTKATGLSKYAERIIQIYDMYQTELSTSASANANFSEKSLSHLQHLTQNTQLQLLSCHADVKTPTWVSSSHPGLPDVVFYSLLLIGSVLFVALGIMIFYCKRTRCLRQPFFDTSSGGDGEHKDADNDLAAASSLVFKHKSVIAELDTRESESVEHQSFDCGGEEPASRIKNLSPQSTPYANEHERTDNTGKRQNSHECEDTHLFLSGNKSSVTQSWIDDKSEWSQQESPPGCCRSQLPIDSEVTRYSLDLMSSVSRPSVHRRSHVKRDDKRCFATDASCDADRLPTLLHSLTLSNQEDRLHPQPSNQNTELRCAPSFLSSSTQSPLPQSFCERLSHSRTKYESENKKNKMDDYDNNCVVYHPQWDPASWCSTTTQAQTTSPTQRLGSRHLYNAKPSVPVTNPVSSECSANDISRRRAALAQQLRDICSSRNSNNGRQGFLRNARISAASPPITSDEETDICEGEDTIERRTEFQRVTAPRSEMYRNTYDTYDANPAAHNSQFGLIVPRGTKCRSVRDDTYGSGFQSYRDSDEAFLSLDEDVSKYEKGQRCTRQPVRPASITLTDDDLDNDEDRDRDGSYEAVPRKHSLVKPP